jgi:hypothetical protein
MSQTELTDEIKEFMTSSLEQMCHQLTSVVDDRFTAMKRQLSAESSATLDAITAKKARLDKYHFKSKGNEQQYSHQVEILDSVESATAALESKEISKAMSILQEGKTAIEARMKLIKLADKSDHGWQTVSEYVTNDLAENSDDEKRINRAERAAERKLKKMKGKSSISAKARRVPSYSAFQSQSTENSSLRPLLGGGNALHSNQIGPCYKLSTSYQFCNCTTHFMATALYQLRV